MKFVHGRRIFLHRLLHHSDRCCDGELWFGDNRRQYKWITLWSTAQHLARSAKCHINTDVRNYSFQVPYQFRPNQASRSNTIKLLNLCSLDLVILSTYHLPAVDSRSSWEGEGAAALWPQQTNYKTNWLTIETLSIPAGLTGVRLIWS